MFIIMFINQFDANRLLFAKMFIVDENNLQKAV